MSAFICDFCGQKEKGKGYLQRHFDKKHREFHCNVCNQAYRLKSNLLVHLRTHFERFVCQYCGLEVMRFEQFQRHLYQKHEPNNKQLILSIQAKEHYNCRFCVRTFPSPIYRNSHELIVHKGKAEDPFKCKLCNLIFITKDELRSHSFEHYSGMIHFCAFSECDRFFKTAKQLKNHSKIHGPAKYECEKCQQKFFQSANFSKHKKRCKGKPKENVIITKEEQEEQARIAKEQFLFLGGKLKSSQRKQFALNQSDKNIESDMNHAITEEHVIEYLEYPSEEVEITLKEEHYDDNCSVDIMSEELTEQEAPLVVIEHLSPEIPEEKHEISERLRSSSPVKQQTLFICEVCAFTTSTQHAFKLHLKQHEADLSCCTINFNNKNELNKHKQLVHNITSKKQNFAFKTAAICDICGFNTRSLGDLRKHIRKHRKSKQKCDICYKEFRDLTRHMSSFHDNDHSCQICGSSFKTFHHLRNHLKTHEQPTECPICHKFLANMDRHLKWHERPNTKLFYCEQCGRVCSTKQAVQEHVQRVHEKMPLGKSYPCPVCKLQFIRNSDLRRHSFIHYTKKIHSCDVPGCNEMFKTSFQLNCHMMIHNPNNEATFQCSFCDKKYLRKAALNKHQKISHSDIIAKLPVNTFKKNNEVWLQ